MKSVTTRIKYTSKTRITNNKNKQLTNTGVYVTYYTNLNLMFPLYKTFFYSSVFR